jgi:PAS domain S-box-containing protein
MSQDYQTLAENSPDGIARFDRQGRFVYVNAQTERTLGRDRAEILGKTNLELEIPEPLARRAQQDLETVVRTGEPMTQTYSFPPGRQHFEARLVPEFDDQGQVAYVLAVSRDVTDRIQATDCLRGQRDFAEELVHTVREPMLVLDPDYIIQGANRSFEQRFGVRSAEIEGLNLDAVCSGRFRAEGLEALLSNILGPARESFEGFDIEMDIPGQGRRTMRLNARQIDHLQRILLAMEDVTDQLDTIAALQDDLRRRKAELTAQANRLSDLVVELSETEDRERQRLADLLHDDLQQLLVGATFHLEMAEGHCQDNPKATSMLTEARRLLVRVVEMSRDLSHGLSPVAMRQQGLAGGLRWLAEQMRRHQKLQVDLDMAGQPQAAESIQMLVYKAIREMLFNIAKHAEVDHARVTVTPGEDCLHAAVEDHGKGFDVEAVLNSPSNRGLGLLSIRERLDGVGGSLQIESTRGQGSRFHLTVPLDEPTGQEPPPRVEPEPALTARGRRDRCVRVLLVDDHAVVREGIASLLEDHPNLEVVAQAVNGRDAIEKVSRHRPDLVLMDYSMPVMNGAEATGLIKSQWPGVRIVGLSMHQEQAKADQMLQAGADAFVPKDAPASELLARIGEGIRQPTDRRMADGPAE